MNTRIPYGVKYILLSAFASCSGLETLSFPASVVEIGPSLAHDSDKLKVVTLGIGRDNDMTPTTARLKFNGIAAPFENCLAIENVYSLYINPPECSVSDNIENQVFDDTTFDTATLYVPVGSRSAYMSKTPWNRFADIRETDFSSLVTIATDRPSITVSGLTVSFGQKAAFYEIYDARGNLIDSGTASSVSLPCSGLYIIRANHQTLKIVV